MEIMTKEESYADRRQLFKNIWDTAMQIDEKDVDNIMAKPKVIKTLRLDEVDKFVIGKRKKERIKNLRTVCKKILDFCDRQDADDLFYEQKKKIKEAVSEGEEQPENDLDVPVKKNKKLHRKKKFKRAKSLFGPKKSSGNPATKSQKKDDYPGISPTSSKSIKSPTRTKRPATFNFVQRTSKKRVLKTKSNTDVEGGNAPPKGSVTRRKVVRKKRSKQKKPTTLNWSPPEPSGIGLTRSMK